MSRPALFLSASLLAAASAAYAQTPVPGPTAPVSQLDRIEQKLDQVLRRLDQPRAASSAPAQAGSTTLGAGTPSLAPSAAPAVSLEAYKPGALAVAHAAPKDVNSLSEIPADSVGGFVYQGGLIAFTDIQTRGVRFVGPVGVELRLAQGEGSRPLRDRHRSDGPFQYRHHVRADLLPASLAGRPQPRSAQRPCQPSW